MSKCKVEFLTSEESDSESVPKSKKRKAESDKPAKKSSKKEKKSYSGKRKRASSSKPERGASGEYMFQLACMRFATVSKFYGKVYVNIREYYDRDGELYPSKKGIGLTLEQWDYLKDYADDIDRAIRKFKKVQGARARAETLV